MINNFQNLSEGYNLNLDNTSVQATHNYGQNLIVPIVPSDPQKCFPYLDYFLMTKSLFGPGQQFCHQKII
jgi:hypothetical protein